MGGGGGGASPLLCALLWSSVRIGSIFEEESFGNVFLKAEVYLLPLQAQGAGAKGYEGLTNGSPLLLAFNNSGTS